MFKNLIKIASFFSFILINQSLCLSQPSSLIDKAVQAARSIVHIEAVNIERAPFGKQSAVVNPSTGQILIARTVPIVKEVKKGAGVIISSSGLIVTNLHTIFGADKIAVHLPDGSTLSAKILHLAEDSDLALLKIDPVSALIPVEFADSNLIHLRDPVINIGSSNLLKETISGGIINSLGINSLTKEVELIKVNINIYKGDSGGPLLNNQGQLIGMMMGKFRNKDRASVAIPSNKIKKLYLDYIK